MRVVVKKSNWNERGRVFEDVGFLLEAYRGKLSHGQWAHHLSALARLNDVDLHALYNRVIFRIDDIVMLPWFQKIFEPVHDVSDLYYPARFYDKLMKQRLLLKSLLQPMALHFYQDSQEVALKGEKDMAEALSQALQLIQDVFYFAMPKAQDDRFKPWESVWEGDVLEENNDKRTTHQEFVKKAIEELLTEEDDPRQHSVIHQISDKRQQEKDTDHLGVDFADEDYLGTLIEENHEGSTPSLADERVIHLAQDDEEANLEDIIRQQDEKGDNASQIALPLAQLSERDEEQASLEDVLQEQKDEDEDESEEDEDEEDTTEVEDFDDEEEEDDEILDEDDDEEEDDEILDEEEDDDILDEDLEDDEDDDIDWEEELKKTKAKKNAKASTPEKKKEKPPIPALDKGKDLLERFKKRGGSLFNRD